MGALSIVEENFLDNVSSHFWSEGSNISEDFDVLIELTQQKIYSKGLLVK